LAGAPGLVLSLSDELARRNRATRIATSTLASGLAD
jgi:hypothetical protein